MDEEKVKQLLVSEDADMLVQTMIPYASTLDLESEQSPHEREQLCKMQILVWSRVMHLTRDKPDQKSTLEKAYQSLGQCWMMLGDIDKAIGQFNHALEVEKSFETLRLFSDLYLNDSKYDTSIDYMKQALETAGISDDQKMIGYTKLGTVFEAQGNFDEAVVQFQKGTALENADTTTTVYADLHTELGSLHEKMGNYADAVKDLTVARDALAQLYGKEDSRTEEVDYMLEVATTFLD